MELHQRRGSMKRALLLLVLVCVVSGAAFAQTVVKKKRPLPYEFGRVVINNFSEKAGFAPVVFDHWLHRAKFTCRLCHVDIAFAMKAGTTGITASDNMNGLYCGSCHNGKMAQDGKRIFESCSTTSPKEEMKKCER